MAKCVHLDTRVPPIGKHIAAAWPVHLRECCLHLERLSSVSTQLVALVLVILVAVQNVVVPVGRTQVAGHSRPRLNSRIKGVLRASVTSRSFIPCTAPHTVWHTVRKGAASCRPSVGVCSCSSRAANIVLNEKGL